MNVTTTTAPLEGALAPGPTVYTGPETEEARIEVERVARGELPERYAEPWALPFFESAWPKLVPGASILDVGAGRRPTLPAGKRPADCEYVGLDISEHELNTAPPEAYDEAIVSDISVRQPMLRDRFDLILSWQALEHVPSMERALENMHAYLRPGGRAVVQISGSRAVFSMLARVTPYPIATRLMERLLGSDPEEKFPTRYDCCRASKLEPLLAGWSEYRIIPRYKGGGYFRFWRPLERTYLRYENRIERRQRCDLATHYVFWATR